MQNNAARVLIWVLLASLAIGFAPASVTLSQITESDFEANRDADLIEAVESDFSAYDLVPPGDINVRVDAGIVTLGGSVDTLLAKQRAVLLVERLKGVRAVVDLIAVKPAQRTDEQIRADVQAALRDDPVADAAELQVRIVDGVVILTGQVDSYAEAQFAGAVVMGARGVKQLRNEIEILVSENRSDDEIQPEIERRFASDPWLAHGLMNVKVDEGRVTLSGSVGSLREKRIASTLAWVAGVRSVDDSDLAVQWWLRREMWRGDKTAVRNDIEISRAVRDALLYDPRLNGARINVRCRLGYVTLQGKVSSLGAKRAAEEDAKNTLGVSRVRNRLVVERDDNANDKGVVARFQAAVRRDAYLANSKVFAVNRQGTIYLDGTVDSTFKQERAEAIAANFAGVIDVINRVEVDRPDADKPDRVLQRDIERQLRSAASLGDDSVAVEVKDGKATLRGVIDTFQQRSTIENMALREGARAVHSELVIRSTRKTIDGLVAELVDQQDVYKLAPEQSGKAFRDLLLLAKRWPRQPDRLPPPPTVSLSLELRNEGTKAISIWLDHDLTEIELGLTGEGAVHVPLQRSFAATFRSGRVVDISPGDSYNIPINSLQYGFRDASERWYWTQAGDYRLQATFTWPADNSGLLQYAVTTKPVVLTVSAAD